MYQVYIDDDGNVCRDPRTYNPAGFMGSKYAGCTTCFNLQSYYRQGGRRCMKHGGQNEFGETDFL